MKSIVQSGTSLSNLWKSKATVVLNAVAIVVLVVVKDTIAIIIVIMVVQNAIIVVIVVDSIREAVAIGVDVIWGKSIF